MGLKTGEARSYTLQILQTILKICVCVQFTKQIMQGELHIVKLTLPIQETSYEEARLVIKVSIGR